ncbi:MAG: hypothetical protein Kow0059_14800 [Candidatus Sumerlaeia bacterium]
MRASRHPHCIRWTAIAAVLAAAGVLGAGAGCAGWGPWGGAPDAATSGYVPAKGDWCLYNLHGNIQMKMFVLDVEHGSVFLIKEYSVAGRPLHSEQALVSVTDLRRYISDDYRKLQWSPAGEAVINLDGNPYRAEVFEAPTERGLVRFWYVEDLPVSGVALVQEQEGERRTDQMQVVAWGRLASGGVNPTGPSSE